MRRQDEHPTLTSMAMGGQLDMEAFPYGESSTLAPGPPQWGPRLRRILWGLRGPSENDFDSAEAYMLAQDKFKAASLQEKQCMKYGLSVWGGTNMQCLTRWHVNGTTCVWNSK